MGQKYQTQSFENRPVQQHEYKFIMNFITTIPSEEGTLSSLAEDIDLSTFFPQSNSHTTISLTYDPNEPEGEPSPVSIVPITRDLHPNTAESVRNAGKALKHYNKFNKGFVGIHNNRLCEISGGVLTQIDRGRLRILLTAHTRWIKAGDDQKGEVSLPFDLLESVLKASSRELDGLPEIKGLYPGVMLMPDGSILSKEGYDKTTGWFFLKKQDVPTVPEIPTKEDLALAREYIESVYHEFLFKERVDYENNLVSLFSAMLRPTLTGPFPTLAVRKNSPRTGGSFLQRINGIAAFGSDPMIYPAPSRPDEMEKLHKTIVKEGPLYAIIDNLPPGASFVSEFLLSATSGNGTASFRDFGTLNQIERVVMTQFAVNGNQLKVSDDVCGRVVLTNILSPKPWQELRFSRTKDELIAYTTEMHPKIVWAFAVFLKNWIAGGRTMPPVSQGNLSEYPEWYRIIAGSLFAAGFHEILSNMDEVQKGDNEADTEGTELLSRIFAKFGEDPFSTGGMKAALVREGGMRKEHQISPDDILDYAPEHVVKAAVNGTLTDFIVGRWLSQMIGRKFSGCGWFLMKNRTTVGVRYQLTSVEKQICLTHSM